MSSERSADRDRRYSVTRNIRGSSLLLTGRGFSLLAKLVSQLLVVRYLSQADYGAWAYALSAVALLKGFATLGLNRGVSRFAAIYHERGQFDRFFGTVVLAGGTIAVTSALFLAGLHYFPDQLLRLTGGDAEPLGLLFIAIFLVPLETLDELLVKLFATFSRARVIFFRQYVLAPVLHLGVVGLLILRDASVTFLAVGYVASALAGVALYGGLLFRLLREEGLIEGVSLPRVRFPLREVLSYTTPLMTSDWLAGLVKSSGVLLLGYFYATEEAAVLKVVIPLALLCKLVMQSFNFLYTPNASRMFATGDHEGINDLYWRTALWIAVLSFPVFAVIFAASTPLTVLMYGAEYEASGVLLAILALGYYVQAGLGFNGTTLKVYGEIRYVVAINLAAAAGNVALMLLLVPRFGTVGAAAAMAATQLLHNVLKQVGLGMATSFSLREAGNGWVYAVLALGLGLTIALRLLAPQDLGILVGGALVISLIVVVLSRKALQLGEVFPELGRVPLLRVVFT